MKKHTILLLMMLFVQSIFANSFYQQLCDFNYNWKKYSNRISTINSKVFNTDVDYIQAHLNEVIPILKSNSTPFLSFQQKANRIKLINLLQAYCQAGLFPVNNYREDRIPVFIDEYNTHCAVGHLLEKTGYEKLAKRIALNNNYAWVKEINEPELLVWQKTSGLTIPELKLIQGAYDFYPLLNLHDPNKYEIPQKPEFMTLYFDKKRVNKTQEKKVWCKGEGKNGILHGRWEQNYSEILPWIVGYFNRGKRTGQWKEYYQGTDQLCRTENWRDNKLNGVRKRFNKAGDIIEEILFKNGKAVTKTNYDLYQSLKFIRKPLDSNIVWTEVYTISGSVLSSGKERVHNPGNLMWFQNIELTALNTAAITSRELQKTSNHRGRSQTAYMNPESGTGLYNAPPLVEYKKEGKWTYYKDYASKNNINPTDKKVSNMLLNYYPQVLWGVWLSHSTNYFNDYTVSESYDSIVIQYKNNQIIDFVGYGENEFLHLTIQYYPKVISPFYLQEMMYGQRHRRSPFATLPKIKRVGQYNKTGKKIGIWKHYNLQSQLFKTENYIIPWKEEETEDIVNQ